MNNISSIFAIYYYVNIYLFMGDLKVQKYIECI